MPLVIHWCKHNLTGRVLANGIHPSSRKAKGVVEEVYPFSVYVFPYSRNKTLNGNWRRNLKTWDRLSGNYNGFVFHLEPEDFPLYAGYWFQIRCRRKKHLFLTMKELTERYGSFFSGKIANERDENGISYNWADFELCIPRLIKPYRILKVVRDRDAKHNTSTAIGRKLDGEGASQFSDGSNGVA